MYVSNLNNDGNQPVNKEYIKRTTNKRLNSFQEYKTAKFSFGLSVFIFLVIFLNGFDLIEGEVNRTVLYISSIYLIESIIQYMIYRRIKSQILKLGEIKKGLRLCGFLLIAFLLTGNIFTAISGFTLINKERTIEYTLSIYMILISVSVMLVSMINLFKDYVANTFMFGMGLLAIVTVFYIFSMYMISKKIKPKDKVIDKKMLPIAAGLIATAVTGNLFALCVGVIIINKYKHKDKEISIEWIDVLTRLFRNNMAVIGMFVIVFLLSLSICSYVTFDYSIAIDNDYSVILAKPSLAYPFGTDNYGRCVFTRIVFGASISLIVGFAVTILPLFIGGMLGAVSGYYGGRVDNVVMRCLDVLFAVPDILLAIAIIAALGTSTTNLILALGIGNIATYARTIRANVMSVSNEEYVEAAKACGAKNGVIILKHIIPNALAPIIVKATAGIGVAVLGTSSLSYLGLGVGPHIPEWGNILKIGSKYLESNSYLAVFPGLAIILIVLAFNFFGDGLRDALDPKLK